MTKKMLVSFALMVIGLIDIAWSICSPSWWMFFCGVTIVVMSTQMLISTTKEASNEKTMP